VEATDLCDGSGVAVQLSAAASSEADDASGNDDGATAGDIQGADIGTADTTLLLRTERNGKGRGGSIPEISRRGSEREHDPGAGDGDRAAQPGEGPEPLLMQVEPASPGSGTSASTGPRSRERRGTT